MILSKAKALDSYSKAKAFDSKKFTIGVQRFSFVQQSPIGVQHFSFVQH
ncbi:MAG: hypothetical protein KAI83_13660 [Thiomargarita sp.]|nr:hypothetical protein [Thiomargarita sp.]